MKRLLILTGFLVFGLTVFSQEIRKTQVELTDTLATHIEYTNWISFIQAYGGGGTASPLTTKGDIYTYTTVDARLPVGTNGQVLKANSATSTGLEWGAATGSPGGSDTQVQFNDGGSFGGDAAFVWDKINDKLTITGDILSDRFLTENAATQSTSGTIDFDTRDNADHAGITLTGNSTLRINYVEDGQSGQVDILQDATGSRTLEINVYSDNATTAVTEYYSGGLENIQPTASTLTSVNYKRQGSKVKIDVVWYEAE
jgi:hypothetical protein